MSKVKLLNSLRHQPLILSFYLPSFIIALSWGIQDPILPLYVRDLGASYGMVGLALSFQALGMMLSDLPSGLTIRWMGQKRAMIIGLILVSLSSFALTWTNTITQVLVCRFLGGMGFSLFGIARHAFITEQASVGKRGRAVALFGGINRIGRFAGPTIGGIIGTAFDLRTPFLVIGALIALALLVVMKYVPSRTTINDTPGLNLRTYFTQLYKLTKNQTRTLVSAGAGQLFAQMVRSGPKTIIPLFAADIIGLDVASIGIILSIGAAIDMTMFYPVGVIMDRFGRKFAIIPSFLIQGIGLLLIPLTNSFSSLALVAGFIGFGNGLGSGTMMTLGADLAPADSRSEFLGMWRLIGDLGFTFGPMTAGEIAGAFALPIAAIVLASSGFLATLIFLFFVPETIHKQGPPGA